MKKHLLILFALLAFHLSYGQLTGVKTIPGDYANIQAAIAALNVQGVGAGGVTFNVAAGHTETFSALNAGLITATGTVSNPIVFQKSGAGANPIVTAGTPGTGTLDYIFCLQGSDYVTFDGIDVQENTGNTTSTQLMEWGYAILKASASDGAQNNVIKNCNISLNKANTASYGIYQNNITPASSTQLTGINTAAGTSSNNKYFSNNISNCYNGIYAYGFADGTAPYAYYDQNNQIGFDGGNTITSPGGSSTSVYGIYTLYQNNLKISNNTVTGTITGTATVYCIYPSTANNANIDITGNNISVTFTGTTSTIYGIYSSGGASGTSNTVNMNNNTVTITYNTATSGGLYGVYHSAGAYIFNCYNNSIVNCQLGSGSTTGTGTFGGLYTFGSNSNAGSTWNMYNNNISGNVRAQSAVGSGTNYYLYNSSSALTFNMYDNTVNNNTAASTGTTYMLYNLSAATTKTMYGNTLTNLNNANGTTYGLYTSSGTNVSVYRNKVQNITANATGNIIYGIYISSGTNVNTYNNFVSELKTPTSTSNPAQYGAYIAGGTTQGFYNNTIYLNGTSTGATFGACGVYASTTPTVELRNNLVVNSCVPGATGRIVAYQRSTTTLTSYAAGSNSNDFFAGTPGTQNLIYYDGTNSDQTLAAFKSRVSPRDASSITELPPFVNIAAQPYNLHIQTSVPTQCESGGATVSTPVAITTDFDGDARYPNAGYPDNVSSPAAAPDIGADEFGGLLLDLTPPNIAFTLLLNTSSTNARTLVATITDPSGVPTAGIGLPRLFWRINAGAYTAVTPTYLGSNQYSFTFGAGVVLNDVVSYYLVAQDNVSPTPNIGASPSAGAAGFTANPPACSTPPTSPFSYIIVGTLGGTYAVGAGQTYPTVTAAIADLNLKEVIAPVTFELWDATYPSETYPLIIYPYVGMDPTRPVTFKPKAGVTATISGTSATGILVLFGVDYITLDGSNSGGSDKSLTWENLSTAANSYVIGVFNLGGSDPASNCTIKNCNIKASSQITNTTWGVILNALGGGYNNIVIENNSIFSARIGIQVAGVATNPALNTKIINNIIGSATDAQAIQYRGITISTADNTLISGNEIMGAFAGNANYSQAGLYITAGATNTKIHGNSIHDWYYNGTGGWGNYGIYYVAESTTVTEIFNNKIYNIKTDGYSASVSSLNLHGIYVGGGGNMKIYHNSINLTGNVLSSTYSSWNSCICVVSGVTLMDIRDNILRNSLQPVSGAMAHKNYAIMSGASNTAFTNINYNNYFSDGYGPYVGYLASDRLTLADWQTATGQDAQSQSLNPQFVSATDLHPTNAQLDNLGVYLASVPKDFDGISRTNPPDMGAYEFGTNPVVITTGTTGITCDAATLSGTVNANGLAVNTYFDYGTTMAYGSTINGNPPQASGNSVTNISAALTGLDAATTYHYRLRVVTTGNVTSYGENQTFTTGTGGAPTAVTNNATNIGTTSATLNGTVNASCNTTTVTFEYGTTAAYGSTVNASQSPLNGGVTTPVSFNLAGLLTGQSYHYRVVATSTAGTTYGADMMFTTGANPPTVVTNPATAVGNFTATLNGTVNANNQTSTVTFEWGTTPSYGNTIAGTPGSVSGTSATPVSANLSGLSYYTTYHFRCVAQNSAGTTYGADQTFTTLCPTPGAAGTITGDDNLCQGTSAYVYSIDPVTFATGYYWTVPTGATIVSGQNTTSITVNYANNAISGNINVYGTNVCGAGTAAALYVTVNPIPVPTITGNDPACVGNTADYVTQTGMSNYVWTVSAGGQIIAGAGTAGITVQWNATGNQSLSVTYTSPAGCPAAAPGTLIVPVSALPNPSIAGSNLLCVGSGQHVYTTEAGFSNYNWGVTAGGTIVSGQGTHQIEVNWTTAGNKTVSVNYENAAGCSANNPKTFAVTVLDLPGAAGTVTGTDELCEGEQANYSVSPVSGATTYDWTVPAGATILEGAGTTAIKVLFGNTSGNVSVVGVNNCGTGTSSPNYFVTVNPIPATPVVTVDLDYLLTSSAPSGNQWYFEGNAIDGATGQTYQAEEEGMYWTVVTLNGCNSDPSNQVEVVFVGMDELPGTSLSIYPIPNKGQFTISVVNQAEKTYNVQVLNHLGARVYENANLVINGKGQLDVDLGNVAEGVYTVSIRMDNNRVMRKIIVTK